MLWFGLLALLGSIVFPVFLVYLFDCIKIGWVIPLDEASSENKLTWPYKKTFIINCIICSIQVCSWLSFIIYMNRVEIIFIPNINNILSLKYWIYELIQVIIMLFLADFMNYFFHRFAHRNRLFYSKVHYVHHEYIHPLYLHPFYYLHPIEMFLQDLCYMLPCGAWTTQTCFTVLLYGCISSTLQLAAHSGMKFNPLLDLLLDPKYHLLHHLKQNCNYSEHFTIMDRVFGTYRSVSKHNPIQPVDIDTAISSVSDTKPGLKQQ